MARQRGNKFQADALIDGKRVRRSFNTREEAEAFERRAASGVPTDSPTTFKEFLDLYRDDLWGDGKNPKSHKFPVQALERLIPVEKPLAEITTPYVMSLVSVMKKERSSNATINRRLSALSKLMRYAEKLEVARRPMIDFLKESEGRDRVLTREEEKKVLNYFDHTGQVASGALVRFLLYTGCRLGEAYTLTRDRVEDNRATFHHTVTKTSKTRIVPLVGPALDGWKTVCRLSNEPVPFDVLSRHTFRGHWDRMKEHLGFGDDDHFVPHMLRHTCCTRLVSNGVPLPQVMLWMGHKNIQTTMRYSHLAPRDLDMAAKVLETL